MAGRYLSHPPDEGDPRIFCSYCVHAPVPATKACLHCEASLCDTHVRTHNTSREHVLTEPSTSPRKLKCSVHNKLLEYFCTQEEVCICISCCLAGEHRGHQVELLDEALFNKKYQLSNILEEIISEREGNEKIIENLHLIHSEVPRKAIGVSERFTVLFRDISEQLEALEKRVQSEVSNQEKLASLRVTDVIELLLKKKDQLSKKVQNIEHLCKIDDPLTFLQGWNQDNDRSCDTDNEMNGKQVPAIGHVDEGPIFAVLLAGLTAIVTSVKINLNIQEATDTMTGLTLHNSHAGESLNPKMESGEGSHQTQQTPPVHVQGNIENITLYGQEATDMLLDVDSAANNVLLSDKLKTASHTEISQNRSDNPKRFPSLQVFTTKTFSSGQHYWDVEMSEYGTWRVGMAYSSVDRTWNYIIGENFKSWCLCREQIFHIGGNNSVKHDRKEIQINPPISSYKIRISLDYDGGKLSFYELSDPIRHLHTYTHNFTEPLQAAIFVSDNAWVRIKS